MSARVSCSGRPSSPTTEPPKRWARCRARSAWRLATKIVPAPCSASARAVSSLVSPAPRITTWRLCQLAEHAQREVHGDRGNARAARADGGLRAHALAGGQRRGEQPVGQRSGDARPQRGLVRAPDLALDLGLPHDHRLQTRGHAVELARRVAVARRVDRFSELGRVDLRTLGEQSQHVALGAHGVAHDEVDLGAVARADHDRLAHLGRRDRRLGELARLGLGEREPLAQRDGRRLVGDAEREQLAHRASFGCRGRCRVIDLIPSRAPAAGSEARPAESRPGAGAPRARPARAGCARPESGGRP